MATNVSDLTTRIEAAIDKATTAGLSLSSERGGLAFGNAAEAMEFAKLMSVSGMAVPAHCRNQPGVCLGLTIQAIEWRMSPFAVANKSYVVNDRLCYESQLIHAVIEQRAPITSRLRHDFSGEGLNRRCRVWATPKGEAEPMVYTSPPFKDITPKNSPLWKTKPDLQLYYNTSRDWARVYFPDVILGVYSDDELEATYHEPTTIASVASRLEAAMTPPVVDDSPQQATPDDTESETPIAPSLTHEPTPCEQYIIRIEEAEQMSHVTDICVEASNDMTLTPSEVSRIVAARDAKAAAKKAASSKKGG